MGSFSDSVRKNVQEMLQIIDTKCYEVSYNLFMAIIQNSPSFVGVPKARFSKGEFINSWMAGSNSFSSATTSVFSDTGVDSKAQVVELKNSNTFLGKDGYVTLSNNVSYAETVEYLGWNKTPAYAPVAKAFLQLAQTNK